MMLVVVFYVCFVLLCVNVWRLSLVCGGCFFVVVVCCFMSCVAHCVNVLLLFVVVVI